MKKITLLAFALNDGHLVVPQLNRFLTSICSQSNQDFNLILADLSPNDNSLNIDKFDRDNIILVKFDEEKYINPAYVRNTLALISTTDYICHVNADCMYSPNFVQILLDNISQDNIVFCRRKQVHEVVWSGSINTVAEAAQECVDAKFDAYTTTGECQALSRNLFLQLGGYYNLISTTMLFGQEVPYARFGDYKTETYAEDCDMYHRTKALGIKHVYIDTIPNTWLLHLGHPIRDLKAKWEESRK